MSRFIMHTYSFSLGVTLYTIIRLNDGTADGMTTVILTIVGTFFGFFVGFCSSVINDRLNRR